MNSRNFGSVQAPSPNVRQGFQDINKEVVATRGVKLKNKNAEILEKEKQEKEEYKQKFNKLADKTIEYQDQKSKKAVDCVSKFLSLATDKVLPRNKGVIASDVEREIRQDIIQLALDLNNDETEEDNGKGSVVVLSVLTKIILLYRDRLNDLEYELECLKKSNKSS
ncbi:MAG: hypothetical protein WC942_01160 [Clostridia bacterium]|jgi:hypothetical protein